VRKSSAYIKSNFSGERSALVQSSSLCGSDNLGLEGLHFIVEREQPGIFAVATLDVSSGLVLSLRTSRRPLPAGTPAAQIPRRYVIAASSPKPNPDLVERRAVYTSVLSKAVTVTVTVAVPPDTPFNDDVYMATDTSGWNPQAIKMQRLDGLHFRIQMDLRGGTEIHYLFTRGAWNDVERDRAGLQRKPRDLFVPGGDSQIVDATIYRWADLP